MDAPDLLRSLLPVYRPPPHLRVSEWAERHRYLSPEASAEPGRWSNARAPHLVAPMDALSPSHPAERVVCVFSSQSGKSEIALNAVGYVIDMDPGPVLVVQPSLTPMGEAFSKDRIAPMLRDSPTLRGKVRDTRTGDTVLHKQFYGGHLTIAGANSPAGLASRPIRYLICDELDRWESTREGDPLLLARKRLQTFRVRRAAKELIVSSPTYADLGILAEYERCTQQHEWHLPCLHCGEYQLPRLRHFHYDGSNHHSVRYVCESCGAEHSAAQEMQVKAAGRWVQVRDGTPEALGFHFNQWASPFARWDDTLAEWRAAIGDQSRVQAVTNTVFAEPWEGEAEKIEPHVLATRAEDWGDELPTEVELMTVGADVQQDRIEAEVVGWGERFESWSVAYEVLPGEPTSNEAFDALLELFRRPCRRADGRLLKPVILCIDSGAFTSHVYEFVKRSKARGIIPVKGIPGMSREHVDPDLRARHKRLAARMRSGKPPELLGVDSIKRTVFTFFAAAPGGVGYCHFPVGRGKEYFLQLTGERLVTVQKRGMRPERRWVPIHSAVEALDCRVYALAARLLAPEAARASAVAAQDAPQPPVARPPAPRHPGGWISRSRGAYRPNGGFVR